jgi:ADP-heptose:LPS heptosyltransferase
MDVLNMNALDTDVCIPSVRTTKSKPQIVVGLIEHFGDIVACEPVARYLKLNHPDNHLSWVVRPEFREIIDTNPYIDETVTVDCLTDWIKISAHGRYDRVVDLHVNYRICQHCQIPLVKRTGNPFVTAHEWFDHGALLEAFSLGAGLPRLSAQPQLYLGPEHAHAVDALELPADFCIVHRVSNDSTKDWTLEGWQALARTLQDSLGLSTIEVGAGKFEDLPRPIDGAISLVNRLPILQTAEVIRRARLFIGIDSGPAHLANALKVPGIVLLGQLHYFRQYCPFTGFYASSSPLVKLVRNAVGRVAEISVDEVADAVRYVAAAAEHDGQEHLGRHNNGRRSRTRGLWPWTEPQALRSNEVTASGLFDLGWYVVHHPELECSPIHPIDHYLLEGSAKGLSPSSTFDFKAYQEADEQMVRLKVNPILHYIDCGRAEGRRIPMYDNGPDCAARDGSLDASVNKVNTISALTGEVQVPRKQTAALEPGRLPRTFAFYLPQFHPIAENNWAHGMGFSEWHNVIKAKPLFRGHYQPRIPGELGFYDLRSEEALDRQIHLAQEHGISGFCFYYYSFNGRKPLYKPIENFLKSHIDAPFMCVWANENWTKRWDGGDREVIIAQHHSDVDDLLVLRELIRLFSDPRYVKIKGRPVFMVYKPHLFPDIRRSVDLWREEIVRQGFSDIYLVMVDDWKLDPHHPREIGFDASYEIPSNIVPPEVLWSDTAELGLCHEFAGRIVDYAKFARYHMSRPFPGYTRFRTVMLPWDNTPRYGLQAIVHVNGQGDAYKLWVLQALLDTYQYFETDERLVFLHSWNEWCEGTYLEPDSKYGRFFLEQTREAVETAQEAITSAGLMSTAHVAAQLLKLQKAKDSGAFQVMQSTRKQVQYACAEVSALRSRVNHLEQDRGRLNHDKEELERKVEELRFKVESIYSSKSWHLTAPLRSVWDRLMGWA